MNNILGHIVTGSLTEGLTMRISPDTHIEKLKTGKFVSIQGRVSTIFFLNNGFNSCSNPS